MSAAPYDPRILANKLIDTGVPVVVCRPNLNRGKPMPTDPERTDQRELLVPPGWSTVTAADCDVSGFRVGVDVLAMVGGHGVDAVDVDTKDGGNVKNLPPFRSFGLTRTPSGGWHHYVRSTGIGKISPLRTSAGHVGDYVGGTPGGGGRLLAYLPGSTRPKYPGKTYELVEDLDLDALLEHDADDDLIGALLAHGGTREGLPGRPAVKHSEVQAFHAEHGEIPVRPCRYGRAAVDGLVRDADAVVPGDPTRGRHGWAVRSATRAVELVRAGCATAADLDRLEETLDRVKPEGGTDWGGVLGWALANATGAVGCGMHSPAPGDTPPPSPISLDAAHAVFQRWLGDDYDLDALDAMLATAAVEQLTGDPLWLLLISGSGNAKTETVQALDGVGAAVTSTISSPGALLSGTPSKDKARDATGGLLRKIGGRGVLVVKDVTSILSMSGDARGEVLAALREVHDGRWERNLGTDGGRTLEWRGRIAVVGAVTTAWDRAHNVVSMMGDRFVLLRMDSSTGRQVAGRRAIGNVGSEEQMRAELSGAVAGVLANVDPAASITVTTDETDRLLAAADLVTRARTGVDYDYRGDVIDAHAPEMPTRFAKELTQVVRGGVAVGMSRHDALRLAIRCARDSMPPLRLTILDDLAANPDAATREARKRLGKPRATVDRQLQALHMLEVLDVDEMDEEWGGKPTTVWRYRIGDGIDPTALDPDSLPVPLPDSAAHALRHIEKGPATTPEPRTHVLGAAESGKGDADPDVCRVCSKPLAPLLVERGLTGHPSCTGDAA